MEAWKSELAEGQAEGSAETSFQTARVCLGGKDDGGIALAGRTGRGRVAQGRSECTPSLKKNIAELTSAQVQKDLEERLASLQAATIFKDSLSLLQPMSDQDRNQSLTKSVQLREAH